MFSNTNKILLVLQFWEGDKKQAMELAKFLADLEPEHSIEADFLFASRFDCYADADVIHHVSRKFDTHSYRVPRRGTGWPDGCNALLFGSLEWVHSMLSAKKVPAYKATFMFEADGGPAVKDWIFRMATAWDVANLNKPVVMAGPLIVGTKENHMEWDHINGNAMLSTDPTFLHWMTRTVSGCPAGVGWDYLLAMAFKRKGWANVPEMRSYYNTPHFTPAQYQEMVAQELIWVHGDKGGDLVKYGRELFKV